MIVIELWKLHYKNDLEIAVYEDNILGAKKFWLTDVSIENKETILALFHELRNHFGFKLTEV